MSRISRVMDSGGAKAPVRTVTGSQRFVLPQGGSNAQGPPRIFHGLHFAAALRLICAESLIPRKYRGQILKGGGLQLLGSLRSLAARDIPLLDTAQPSPSPAYQAGEVAARLSDA